MFRIARGDFERAAGCRNVEQRSGLECSWGGHGLEVSPSTHMDKTTLGVSLNREEILGLSLRILQNLLRVGKMWKTSQRKRKTSEGRESQVRKVP